MAQIHDNKISIKIKLSALWTSAMFCYIYADYFLLFAAGKLQSMMNGQIPPLGQVTEGVLVFTSAMMAIPGLMIALSVILSASVNRWMNIVFGSLYTLIILLTMWAYAFTIFFGVIEVTLTLLIVWFAWKWPTEENG